MTDNEKEQPVSEEVTKAEAIERALATEQFVTKSGKVLTDEDLEALADEAEQGYDVTSLQGVVQPLPGMPTPFMPTAYVSAMDRVLVALEETENRLSELRKERDVINAEIKVLVEEQELLERMAKIKKKTV